MRVKTARTIFSILLLLWPAAGFAALADNLVAFWELEESSGTRTDAHDDNDLTEIGSVVGTTGKVGTAGDFEATDNDRLRIADNADLSMGDIDFTIAAWVHLESLQSASGIVGKASGGTHEYYLRVGTVDNRFRLSVTSDGTTATVVNADNLGAPSTGVWYFVVAWHDSVNNQIGISVNDGSANTTATSAGVHNGTANFTIGDNDLLDQFMDGLIDQVGIWKRVLTSGERTTLYNSGNGMSYADIVGGGATFFRRRISP